MERPSELIRLNREAWDATHGAYCFDIGRILDWIYHLEAENAALKQRVGELEAVKEAAETCLGVDEHGPCFQPSYKYAPLLKEALDKLKEAP